MNCEALKKRIASQIVTDGNGCWLWQGTVKKHGYGVIGVNGKQPRIHRVAYELYKGPIPFGLVIDHLCRVKNCCNPDHLEAVKQRENTRRGINFIGANMAATHCKHGHEFTPENTLWYKGADGRSHRQCKGCRCVRHRVRRQRMRDERNYERGASNG